jgi:type I restriction-modification system DNA methylase subunit
MNPTQYGVYRNGQTYVAATNHGLSGSGGSAGTIDFGTLFGSLYPYGSGWGGEPGFSINGKFYQAKIYNRVLSAAEVQQNFPIKTGETAYLFLQHFIKILKANGRGGVVIKNTFLSNTDNASVSLRQKLLEE